MAFDITDYKIKQLVSLSPDLINETRINLDIEGTDYVFKSDQVRSSMIEFVYYSRYEEVKLEMGPLEKILKNFTYGKSFNQFSEYEVYKIKKSTFKADVFGNPYEFEISGVGPIALKISLYISFNKIENEDKPLERLLKKLIQERYGRFVENNDSYKEKLDEIKKKSDAEEQEQARIREEVRREQEEKERKRKELEEFLNRDKPKNNRPFKMY